MNFGLNTLANGTSGLSLVRILGSLSRTMGVVKQIAPIYKEVKPLLSKAPLFFQKLNSLRNVTYNMQNTGLEMAKNFNISNNQTDDYTSSGPVFFQ